jgi:hypothetical protein
MIQTMPKKQTLCGTIVVALLTFAGMYSLYWLLFSAWMMAYPFASHGFWRVRFYMWLATSIFIGAVWSGLVVWLVRRRRTSN